MSSHLVLLLIDLLFLDALVSESCRITWFSYTANPCSPGMSFHGRAEPPGSLTLREAMTPLSEFQSCSEPPGSLTAGGNLALVMLFQGRARSPSSHTNKSLKRAQAPGFRAVSNYLVLLPVCQRNRSLRSFRAVPNHLVLLLSYARLSGRHYFTAVSNYLVLLLLTARAFASCCFTAVPTTWFSYDAI